MNVVHVKSITFCVNENNTIKYDVIATTKKQLGVVPEHA